MNLLAHANPKVDESLLTKLSFAIALNVDFLMKLKFVISSNFSLLVCKNLTSCQHRDATASGSCKSRETFLTSLFREQDKGPDTKLMREAFLTNHDLQ